MSPTGQNIHETVFKKANFTPPVKIGILETPTGYEVNAIHGWPERMEKFFKKSLKNYHPEITRIRAWRKDGPYSTNNPEIVDVIADQDYLYCGAGSPVYTVRHLENSRAYGNIMKAHLQGTALCFGSATAIAMSQYALPVYEIFKTGTDLYWEKGLDFFETIGLKNIVVIPHWNNKEGEDFDTTRSWMGKERFETLRTMLPHEVVVLGIDEQTAVVFDLDKKRVNILGVGSMHVLKSSGKKDIPQGSSISIDVLS